MPNAVAVATHQRRELCTCHPSLLAAGKKAGLHPLLRGPNLESQSFCVLLLRTWGVFLLFVL